MAAQRAARRFVMVMPAGNAAHIEARVAFGLGKPCYAVGPVAKTETLYRFFDRMFTSSDDSASWLASPLVTTGNGRPARCQVKGASHLTTRHGSDSWSSPLLNRGPVNGRCRGPTDQCAPALRGGGPDVGRALG